MFPLPFGVNSVRAGGYSFHSFTAEVHSLLLLCYFMCGPVCVCPQDEEKEREQMVRITLSLSRHISAGCVMQQRAYFWGLLRPTQGALSSLKIAFLDSPEILLGRAGSIGCSARYSCDVTIPLKAVSRSHCSLMLAPRTLVAYVKDQSKGGTFVNGKRLKKQTVASGNVIKHGQELGLSLSATTSNGQQVKYRFEMFAQAEEPLSWMTARKMAAKTRAEGGAERGDSNAHLFHRFDRHTLERMASVSNNLLENEIDVDEPLSMTQVSQLLEDRRADQEHGQELVHLSYARLHSPVLGGARRLSPDLPPRGLTGLDM